MEETSGLFEITRMQATKFSDETKSFFKPNFWPFILACIDWIVCWWWLGLCCHRVKIEIFWTLLFADCDTMNEFMNLFQIHIIEQQNWQQYIVQIIRSMFQQFEISNSMINFPWKKQVMKLSQSPDQLYSFPWVPVYFSKAIDWLVGIPLYLLDKLICEVSIHKPSSIYANRHFSSVQMA